MHKQHYTMLHKVLTQVEPVDSVRLLTWFFSTFDNPAVAPACSMGEVFHCCATGGRSFCWQHYSRIWELSCLSVCGFSCANMQPSTLGSYSASSSSTHVQHQGFLAFSQVTIICTHHQHQSQEGSSFLQQCIWWPTWQEGSHQTGEIVHQWWKLQIKFQWQISSSCHQAW